MPPALGAPAGPREGLSPPLRIDAAARFPVLARLRTSGQEHGGNMPAKPLPERPDLEQLMRQAKELLRTAPAKDPGALARFRALPALARASDHELAHEPLALHDAQSVIAREHGFASWNALRARVEELTLDLEAALLQFVEAA